MWTPCGHPSEPIIPEEGQQQANREVGVDDYLAQLLLEAREEVLDADSKASIILAGLGVGVGARYVRLWSAVDCIMWFGLIEFWDNVAVETI